jgi:hypothetical protein
MNKWRDYFPFVSAILSRHLLNREGRDKTASLLLAGMQVSLLSADISVVRNDEEATEPASRKFP